MTLLPIPPPDVSFHGLLTPGRDMIKAIKTWMNETHVFYLVHHTSYYHTDFYVWYHEVERGIGGRIVMASQFESWEAFHDKTYSMGSHYNRSEFQDASILINYTSQDERLLGSIEDMDALESEALARIEQFVNAKAVNP